MALAMRPSDVGPSNHVSKGQTTRVKPGIYQMAAAGVWPVFLAVKTPPAKREEAWSRELLDSGLGADRPTGAYRARRTSHQRQGTNLIQKCFIGALVCGVGVEQRYRPNLADLDTYPKETSSVAPRLTGRPNYWRRYLRTCCRPGCP